MLSGCDKWTFVDREERVNGVESTEEKELACSLIDCCKSPRNPFAVLKGVIIDPRVELSFLEGNESGKGKFTFTLQSVARSSRPDSMELRRTEGFSRI
jgi:hypothetical protein